MSDLRASDFAGVEVRGGKFEMSIAARLELLRHANLTGSSFQDERGGGRQLRRRRPDRRENMSMSDLARASFRGSILVRTDFACRTDRTPVRRRRAHGRQAPHDRPQAHRLQGAAPSPAWTSRHSDLRGLNLDGATFTSMKFEKWR